MSAVHRATARVAAAIVHLAVGFSLVHATARVALSDARCPGILQDDVCAEANATCSGDSGPVGLAASEWPAYQQNAQHTGKSPHPGPTCNRVIWSQKIRGAMMSAPSVGLPPPGQSHGIVYVPVFKFPVCALDPATGEVYWCETDQKGKLPDRSSPALGNGNQLVIGTRDNDTWNINLPALPEGKPTVAWRQKICTDGDVSTPPIIGPDGVSYFGSDSLHAGTLMAMCPGPTRQVKWCIHPVGGGIKNVSPALSPGGDELYVTIDGAFLAAFHPSTGAEIFRIRLEDQTNGFRKPNFSPVVNPSTGRIYVGFDEGLWAVDVTTGPGGERIPTPTMLYRTATARQRIGSPPALDLARGRIYFGAAKSSVGTLYAIDLNGNLAWKRDLANTNFRNTPPVVDASGNVFVAADRTLYAYSLAGASLWTFEAEEPFFAAPILGNGRLYAGTSRGRVYAIGDCP